MMHGGGATGTVGDMAGTVSLTYRELAERLCITVNSARIKARRRKWRITPGNHPLDPVRVEVPIELLSQVAPRGVGEGGATVAPPGDATPSVTDGTEVTLATVFEMIGAERAHHLAEITAERQRHTAEIERLIGQVHAERSFWIERADRAEVIAEQALERAQAAEQRAAELANRLVELAEWVARPWWRRWI